MFKPVKKTRIYEDIIFRIRGMVTRGELSAGDQLPSERELSAAFRVSRPSVREALKTLEIYGYLQSWPGKGTFVSRKPIEQFVEPLAAAILAEKEFQIQILEMRRMIEPQIASLAAEKATKDEMSRLERTLDLQKEKVRRGEPSADLDKIFHYVVAVSSKNRLLMRIIDMATDLFAENRNRYLQFAERPQKSVLYHKEILGAITAGDSVFAADAMHEHLNDIHETLFAMD